MKNILVQMKIFRKMDFPLWLIIALGVFLRLRQYFANRSLWVDEASLALNIVDRTFGSLALPLDYDQGAPIGFLFIEKILVLIFGNHDYILRLFPLFSGVLATYIIYRIASEYFGTFGMVAALLFSLSDSMIYYSSELKQYSSDVMIASVLVYLALLCIKQNTRMTNYALLGFVGVFAIGVSHPSAFVLAVVGPLLVVENMLQKAYLQIRWLVGIVAAWGVTFLITYTVSLRHLIGNDNLQTYWEHSYSPLPPWEHLDWYKNILVSMMPHVSPSFFPGVIPNFRQEYLMGACITLVLVGVVSLFLRNKKLALLVIAPILLAFIASAIHRYPTSDRFLFFWFPSLLLLMAEGLGRIYTICAKINFKAGALVYGCSVLILLWTPLVTSFNNAIYPPMGEDVKPVLGYIQEHLQSNDIVYVHNGSINSFVYYAPFYQLDSNEIFIAKKSWNVERFRIDVTDFQGSERIWFIFSHIVSCDCDGDTREERMQAHVRILDEYGIQLDRFEASKAAVYLYDLNP